jgi:hypothetical protein
VLYTRRPEAGEIIVVASVVEVRLTRGRRKPLLLEFKSKAAEELGVLVPIPTWAKENVDSRIETIEKIYFILLITLL